MNANQCSHCLRVPTPYESLCGIENVGWRRDGEKIFCPACATRQPVTRAKMQTVELRYVGRRGAVKIYE